MRMKANFRNVIVCVLSLLIFGCFFDGKRDDLGPSKKKMHVTGKIVSDNIIINILLTSIDSQVLVFHGAMINLGCPNYEESRSIFKSIPKLDELSNSQILIENENHEFKIFSSGITDNGTAVLTNCFEVDTIKLNLEPNKEQDFIIEAAIEMIRINKSDQKARIHLFYKDDRIKNGGFIVSSKNWINLK